MGPAVPLYLTLSDLERLTPMSPRFQGLKCISRNGMSQGIHMLTLWEPYMGSPNGTVI